MKKIFLAAVLLAANSFGAQIIQTANTGTLINGEAFTLLFNGFAFYGISSGDVTSITVDVSNDATGTTNTGGANFAGGTVTFNLVGDATAGNITFSQYTQALNYGGAVVGVQNGLIANSSVSATPNPQDSYAAGTVGGVGSTYIAGVANVFDAAGSNPYYAVLANFVGGAANWNTGALGTGVRVQSSFSGGTIGTNVFDTLSFNSDSTVRVIFNTREATGEVPEPSTVALIGAGLIGLASVARRRR